MFKLSISVYHLNYLILIHYKIIFLNFTTLNINFCNLSMKISHYNQCFLFDFHFYRYL